MTNKDYKKLIDQHPELTSEGFGVNMEYAEGRTRKEYIELKRRELEDHFDNFMICVEWLKVNPIDERRSAHTWKDRIQFSRPKQKWIPRGVFILAALYSGLKVTKMKGDTGAWIESEEKNERKKQTHTSPIE